MISWSDYRKWLGDIAIKGPIPNVAAPDIAQLSTDSRTISPGSWFVPIEGNNFDGHNYIVEAVNKGASGFFYNPEKVQNLEPSILSLGLPVHDPLGAFQAAASGWRKSLKNIRVIGLTGSAGKTTTKEMLAAILRADGPTFATLASFNNEIGVPKSLQQLTSDLRYAALEFGARQPGNIKFLCEMAAPDIVGLLNVGTAHLGVFGSVENLLATKLEIFRNSPAHAVQVAYRDDQRIYENALKTGKKTLSFGTSPQSDVRLLSSEWLTDGAMNIRLRLATKTELTIKLGVAHEVFPINAAAAATLALAAGVRVDSIATGLSGFRGIRGRYYVQHAGGLSIVDDTYNANPESMTAGLKTVSRAFAGRRIVLVLGDMLELGPSSSKSHESIGRDNVAPINPDLLITVGTEAKKIADGAKQGGLENRRIKSFDSIQDLLAANLDFQSFGQVVYAKGSNGVRLSKLIETLTVVKK